MDTRSVKASRKGRNLVDYRSASLGFKSQQRRRSYFGNTGIYENMRDESFMKNANYGGRNGEPQVKRNTTLSKALAAERRQARPGHLMGESGEFSPSRSGGASADADGSRAPTPRDGQRHAGWQSAKPTPSTAGTMTPPGTARSAPGRPEVDSTPVRPMGARLRDDATNTRVSWVDDRSGQGRARGPGLPRSGSSGNVGGAGSRLEIPQRPASAGALRRAASGSSLEPGPIRHKRWAQRHTHDTVVPTPPKASFNGVQQPEALQRPKTARAGATDSSDSRRLSNSASFAARGSDFGLCERLEPKKWQADSSNPKACVGVRIFKQERRSPAKDELDGSLATMLHARATSSSSSPRRAPHRPMGTAFTDRSLRKREGLGSRAALAREDPPSPEVGHTDCSCAVCKPFALRSAGQLSHSVRANVLHPAHHGTDLVPPSSLEQEQALQGATRRAGRSPNFNSGHVTTVLRDSGEASGAPRPAHCPCEHNFARQMGRKIKQAACQRAHSADGAASAGRHRRRESFDLENPWLERSRILGASDLKEKVSVRCNVAMILTPRNSDPPLPLRITKCKKGEGDHKNNLSEESEKISLHWNQPLYRYEMPAREGGQVPRRSQSLPPDRFGRSKENPWNPVTNTLIYEDHEDSHERAESCQATGRGIRREPSLHESAGMTEATNHRLVAELGEASRRSRLRTEQRFADLCALTERTQAHEAQQRAGLKDRNNHKTSANMVDVLTWIE